MSKRTKKNDDIAVYIEDREYIANKYVMKCFAVTMWLYALVFVLNVLNIFIIDKRIMLDGFVPSMIIYVVVYLITRCISLSNEKTKYFILGSVILVITIIGVSLTYHAVLLALLPFVYATLYSSKRVMRYVYILTVISTIVTVYGGYYLGLCDANMALLTAANIQEYAVDGHFVLSEINPSPFPSLLIFYVAPRCMIYVAFMTICNSIFNIVSGSLEKAKLAAELEKAKTEAENANKAKTQFLAKMSHEIRTPINAVMGLNEMIMSESKEEKIQEYAEDLKASSEILLSIINDILDSSKIESGMMELLPVNYSIGSLFNDLYNMINMKAKDKNLELVFDVDSSMPREYFGDDKRIRQILLNLLTNVVKYTNEGTVTFKVSCTVKGDIAVLHYAVKDTGIGIRKEDIGKIYNEFQRLDVTRNRNVEGTGLGMKITQQFLKLMGSELKIESEYEKGSEFSFDLEQKIVNAAPLGDFRGKLLKTKDTKKRRLEFTAPDARVLVVDDNKMNRKVFCGILTNTQMQITEAESGRQCLELLENQKFDLVFLDHMMPDMDGIETLHLMKERGLCNGVPVIMLTANAIVGDREMYLGEGFDDFLSKPIVPDKLDVMLVRYLPKKLVMLSEEAKQELSGFLREEVRPEPLSKAAVEQILNKMKWELPELDTEAGLTVCGGKEMLYMELMDEFINMNFEQELTVFYSTGDYKNYCVKIHGFKNNAYSVGAKKLGELAFEMEKRTREGLPEEVIILQNRLFEQYDRICENYRNIVKRVQEDYHE